VISCFLEIRIVAMGPQNYCAVVGRFLLLQISRVSISNVHSGCQIDQERKISDDAYDH